MQNDEPLLNHLSTQQEKQLLNEIWLTPATTIKTYPEKSAEATCRANCSGQCAGAFEGF